MFSAPGRRDINYEIEYFYIFYRPFFSLALPPFFRAASSHTLKNHAREKWTFGKHLESKVTPFNMVTINK